MAFRLRGSKKRTAMLAVQGEIRGGKYAGWRYTFERFSFIPPRGVHVHVIGNPPTWPFPKDLVLGPHQFAGLVPVAGERAKKVNADALIAQIVAPVWAAAEEGDRRLIETSLSIKQVQALNNQPAA